MEIRTINLTKRYGAVCALSNVNIDVPAGCFTLLFGSSDAGKTTLIQILVGLVQITWGEPRVGGFVVGFQTAKILPHIAYVPSGLGIHADLTVEADLMLYRRALQAARFPRIATIEAVVGLAGLTDKATCLSELLDSEARARLCIARAMLRLPELLLADSVTDDLSGESKGRIASLLHSIHEEGVGIFVTARERDGFEELCDEYIHLEGGEIVALQKRQERNKRIRPG
jgi:ABC-2 type transport system ATP-binding protein